MVTPFVRKLQHGSKLSPEDERLLQGLVQSSHRIGARQDILHEGDCPRHLVLVLEGWACRYKLLDNGRRQIIAFFMPGDLCQPFGALPRFMDHAVSAITPLTYAKIHPDRIKDAAKASSRVELALWWDALVAAAIQNERVVSLGRRQAVERMGHLVCELQVRLEAIGVASRTGFEFPFTQADIGDALGLSTVHTNRSLRDLRAKGLMTLRGRYLHIHDLASLREASLFDPAYLHMDETETGTVPARSDRVPSREGAR